MELAALHIVDRQMPRLCQILCRGGGNIAHLCHCIQPALHDDSRRMGGQNDLHIGIQFSDH